MKIYKYPAESEWAGLLARPTFDNATLFDTVRTVLNDVKEKGDGTKLLFGFKRSTHNSFNPRWKSICQPKRKSKPCKSRNGRRPDRDYHSFCFVPRKHPTSNLKRNICAWAISRLVG